LFQYKINNILACSLAVTDRYLLKSVENITFVIDVSH